MDIDKLIEGVKSILALTFVNLFGIMQFLFTNQYWLMIVAITLDSAALGYSQIESRTKKLMDSVIEKLVKGPQIPDPAGTGEKKPKVVV